MLQKYWYSAFNLQDFAVIDLRSAADYDRAHYPNSYSTPSIEKANKKIQALDKSKDILLVDYASQRQALKLWDNWQTSRRIYVYPKGFSGLYKALSQVFEQSYNWLTLGGKTGTGKTAVLNYLKKLGTPVLNLEALAESKGSVFDEVESALSQEQFEINLALAIVALNSQALCLIEREGSKIGGVFLPASLHSTLQKAKCIWLKRPVEDRLTQVLKDFGDISSLNLQKGLVKLASALGEEAFKKIDKLARTKGGKKAVAEELLKYYDEQPGYQKPVKVLKEIRVTKPAETARKIQAVLASIKEVG